MQQLTACHQVALQVQVALRRLDTCCHGCSCWLRSLCCGESAGATWGGSECRGSDEWDENWMDRFGSIWNDLGFDALQEAYTLSGSWLVPETLETFSFTFILLCAHHIHFHTFAWPCCWLYRHAKMALSRLCFQSILWFWRKLKVVHVHALADCSSVFAKSYCPPTGPTVLQESHWSMASVVVTGAACRDIWGWIKRQSATASVLTEVLHTAHKRQPLGSPGKRVLPRLVTWIFCFGLKLLC